MLSSRRPPCRWGGERKLRLPRPRSCWRWRGHLRQTAKGSGSGGRQARALSPTECSAAHRLTTPTTRGHCCSRERPQWVWAGCGVRSAKEGRPYRMGDGVDGKQRKRTSAGAGCKVATHATARSSAMVRDSLRPVEETSPTELLSMWHSHSSCGGGRQACHGVHTLQVRHT